MSEKKKQRILLASDTHGRNDYLERVLKAYAVDMLVFCGDGEGLEDELCFIAGSPAQVSMVRGNNDYNYSLKDDLVISIGAMQAFVTHGHRYRLYEGMDMLGLAARGRNCSICLFGHIHRPVCMRSEGVLFINPGSLSEPRQEGHVPTCAILEAEGNELRVRFINALTMQDYRQEVEPEEPYVFRF